jgi:hypothetical protein
VVQRFLTHDKVADTVDLYLANHRREVKTGAVGPVVRGSVTSAGVTRSKDQNVSA